MTAIVRGYLTAVERRLHLEPTEEQAILDELQGHIEDRARDLADGGNPYEEALARAVDELGASTNVADGLHAVHTQSAWPYTALAAFPHVLLALMFAVGLWTAPAWIIALLVVATVISVMGWMRGRPTWTYPWLGYCLVAPVVSWGLAGSAVTYGALSIVTTGALPLEITLYSACLAYLGVSLWVAIKILTRVVRRDWLMASLAVLPLPFLAYWFLYFYNRSESRVVTEELGGVDRTAAVVFLLLGGATILFFRVGRRVVRIGLLAITAPSAVVLAWLSYKGGPSYMTAFAFSAVSLAAMFGPALLDYKQRGANPPATTRDEAD